MLEIFIEEFVLSHIFVLFGHYWLVAFQLLQTCLSDAEVPIVHFILFKIVRSSPGDESKKNYKA